MELKGYEVKNMYFQKWIPIFDQWIQIVENGCDLFKGSPIYLYFGKGEFRNVHLLSIAAWKCGCASLTENCEDKTNGRSDLIVCFEDGEQSKIEAKYSGASIGHDTYFTWFDKEMEKACLQLHQYDIVGYSAVGIVFVCPVYSNINDLNGEIANSFSEISKAHYDAIAWCFPESTRRYTDELNRAWPGIIMVLKHCQ